MAAQHGNPGDVMGTSSNSPKVTPSGPSFTQSTSGVGVVSGISEQSGFHSLDYADTGHCTKKGSANQVPKHPDKSVSTDRGGFTIY